MITTREGTSYSLLWYTLIGDTLYVKEVDGTYRPIRYNVETF